MKKIITAITLTLVLGTALSADIYSTIDNTVNKMFGSSADVAVEMVKGSKESLKVVSNDSKESLSAVSNDSKESFKIASEGSKESFKVVSNDSRVTVIAGSETVSDTTKKGIREGAAIAAVSNTTITSISDDIKTH